MPTQQVAQVAADLDAAYLYIDGDWRAGSRSVELRDPFHDKPVTRVEQAGARELDDALVAAVATKAKVATLAGHERAAILRKASELLRQRGGEIARCLTGETGKTVRDTLQEVSRAAEVLSFCAEEATRIEGRHIPLEGSSSGAGKIAVGLRFPVGVVGAIVPFNAPVNLACHKIGPAFAAGNCIVLKAPLQAPRTLALLFEVLAAAGFPAGSIALLHGDAELGEALVADERVEFISFTGSARAGRAIKAATGLRGCILELGGIGPTIVHDDADLVRAANACTQAGYRLAGQSCASVQNLFVQAGIFDGFAALMIEKVKALKTGDPMDPTTDVGPVIDERAAERIVAWTAEAVDAGATLLCGGARDGRIVEPTLLTGVTTRMKVVCEEVFGPVIVLRPYRELGDVYAWIEGTGLGLNCGLFTASHAVAIEAVRTIPCATIVINGTSTFRPDQMPYGGLRGSGYGRESPRDSVRAMTQERILVFT